MVRVRFPHPVGIVIASEVTLDDTVVIYQNVTIGRRKASGNIGYPKLKKGCVVYAGAVVAGNIVLGEGVVVAANAVVTRDVSCGLVYGYNRVVETYSDSL